MHHTSPPTVSRATVNPPLHRDITEHEAIVARNTHEQLRVLLDANLTCHFLAWQCFLKYATRTAIVTSDDAAIIQIRHKGRSQNTHSWILPVHVVRLVVLMCDCNKLLYCYGWINALVFHIGIIRHSKDRSPRFHNMCPLLHIFSIVIMLLCIQTHADFYLGIPFIICTFTTFTLQTWLIKKSHLFRTCHSTYRTLGWVK